jgi:hypothetical protein
MRSGGLILIKTHKLSIQRVEDAQWNSYARRRRLYVKKHAICHLPSASASASASNNQSWSWQLARATTTASDLHAGIWLLPVLFSPLFFNPSTPQYMFPISQVELPLENRSIQLDSACS